MNSGAGWHLLEPCRLNGAIVEYFSIPFSPTHESCKSSETLCASSMLRTGVEPSTAGLPTPPEFEIVVAKTSIAGWPVTVVRPGGQPVMPQYSVEHERSFLRGLFSRFGVTKGLALDIGCGDGFFTDLLDEMHYETCGVDFDSERITAARRRYKRNFIIADSRCPPFPKGTFDLIFCRGLSTLSNTDLRLESAAEQRETLFNLLTVHGLFVYQTASDLSGKDTTIHNYQIADVSSFFMMEGFHVSIFFFFAITFLLRLLGDFAFSSVITRLSRVLTELTGRPGYIVCAVKRR
jgi:SAM-dependent methyltransferase